MTEATNTSDQDQSPSDTFQSQSTFSSKTDGSAGSSGSGFSVTTDKSEREDFTKDNSASPVDLECAIQSERITKILDEAICKIKVAICLPRLVQNRILETELSFQCYDEVMLIYDQYDSQLFSASLLNMSAVEDIKSGDLSMKNRLSPEQGHLLYVLNSVPTLRVIINEIIEEMKQDYVSETSRATLQYLLTFEHFRELMVRQLRWTAAEELEAKIHTRKFEDSNEKLKEKIAELSESLIKEREDFEKTLKIRAQIIANLEHDLSMQNFEAAQKLRKKILDSDRQMVLMTRAHIVREELLKEEEENIRGHYSRILFDNMKEEKTQRQRRFKVETQLLSWVQKYDTEMSDKQTELEEFEIKYEEEKGIVEYLEEELAEQDKKYLPLMAEREAEYAQEMKTKMDNFVKEHAAKILQTAWRQVLANRKEKKKLKKMVKKIKEAEKKAERINYLRYMREQKLEAARKKKEKKEAKAAKRRK